MTISTLPLHHFITNGQSDGSEITPCRESVCIDTLIECILLESNSVLSIINTCTKGSYWDNYPYTQFDTSNDLYRLDCDKNGEPEPQA